MENKQVSFAKHTLFYKKFFETHKRYLDKFINLNYSNLVNGYDYLLSFYSSYSYYLDTEENFREHILLMQDNIRNSDNRLKYLLLKSNEGSNLTNLTYEELKEFNKIWFDYLIEILEIFESFINTLAPDDILPNLTEMTKEYNKNVMFANYETFYENLFNLHTELSDRLSEIDIFNFINVFPMLLAFYYGHSFYIKRKTKNEIKTLIYDTWDIYNSKDNLIMMMQLLNEKLTKNNLEVLKDTRRKLFLKCSEIFSLLNKDLSGNNLMPKKKEKVLIDMTLI